MAYIAYKDNLFWGVGSFEEKYLWRDAGFQFSKLRKAWTTPSLEVAMRVQGIQWTKQAGEYARQQLQMAEQSYDTSWAATTDFVPIYPRFKDGSKPFPFQCAGVEYALGRKDTLIADEPGLGKTVQAILVHNCDQALKQTLIVCPASLKENWRREWVKWSTKKGLSVGIAEACRVERVPTGKVYQSGKKVGQPVYRNVEYPDYWPDTDVVIINYDVLERFTLQIKTRVWDYLICDECHALKSETSKRTLFVLGGVELVPVPGRKAKDKVWWSPVEAIRRVFLSGTPILNRPIELWPLLHAFDRHGLGKDKREYEYRYCAGHTGRHGFDNSGASNLDELGGIMRETMMIRRKKREVLPELPGVFRRIVTVDSPEIRQLVAREDEIAEALHLYEKHVAQEAMEIAGDEGKTALEAWEGAMIAKQAQLMGVDRAFKSEDGQGEVNVRELDMEYITAVSGLEPSYVAILFEELALVRKELGIAKLTAAIPWIKDYLTNGDKLLIFAYHGAVVEAIRDALAYTKPAVIYGKTAVRKRQAEVDQFQNDEECRTFIGNLYAAGVGLTLTRGSEGVFVEGDWVPSIMTQAEDRMCRIGQTAERIMSFHLVANGSLDARIAQSAQIKAENIAEALDTRRA